MRNSYWCIFRPPIKSTKRPLRARKGQFWQNSFKRRQYRRPCRATNHWLKHRTELEEPMRQSMIIGEPEETTRLLTKHTHGAGKFRTRQTLWRTSPSRICATPPPRSRQSCWCRRVLCSGVWRAPRSSAGIWRSNPSMRTICDLEWREKYKFISNGLCTYMLLTSI